MNQTSPAIDSARLRALLDGVNAYGRSPATGGFNRIGFSDADMAARRWFAGEMARDGLAVHTDPAGNVFGRWGAADEPCLMVGSHLDTVPEGGAFDGALGVSVALECVRAMRDAGLAPAVPIEVAAFAEEEGRFGGMLGSQAVAGQVTEDWIETATDAEGVRLADAMRAQGFEPHQVPFAARPRGSVRVFLELHIEQGPVLETAGMPIGLAHCVSGVRHLAVRLEGRADHSGTTPMDLRADAFVGLAEIACAIPGIVAAHGTPESRITIGRVALEPNFPHTVPGAAEFSVILRDTDEEVMRAIERALREAIGHTAARGLRARIAEMSRLRPVAFDPGLLRLLKAEAAGLDLPCLEMASGAGHDAQTMQALCPSALVFVPSRNGISHAPEEWTNWPDIEKGAALMLAAVARLSGAKAPPDRPEGRIAVIRCAAAEHVARGGQRPFVATRTRSSRESKAVVRRCVDERRNPDRSASSRSPKRRDSVVRLSRGNGHPCTVRVAPRFCEGKTGAEACTDPPTRVLENQP